MTLVTHRFILDNFNDILQNQVCNIIKNWCLLRLGFISKGDGSTTIFVADVLNVASQYINNSSLTKQKIFSEGLVRVSSTVWFGVRYIISKYLNFEMSIPDSENDFYPRLLLYTLIFDGHTHERCQVVYNWVLIKRTHKSLTTYATHDNDRR